MGIEIRKNLDYTADKVNFKGFGIEGSASGNTTTNLDYLLTEERLIYGGQAIVETPVFDDKISFQVIDKDNILGYGAGVMLGEYIKDWYIAADTQAQPTIMVDYPTKVMAGLYIRLRYTRASETTTKVKFNIYCVKNIT